VYEDLELDLEACAYKNYMLSISETKHVLAEILRAAVTVFEVHCLLRIIDTYRTKDKAVSLQA